MDDNYLPIFAKKENIISSGKNFYEGYQRGWGLKYGDLRRKILEDPIFDAGYALIKGKSIIDWLYAINGGMGG